MHREANLINEEFREGVTCWTTKTNCDDFTRRILKAGGMDASEYLTKLEKAPILGSLAQAAVGQYSLPLDSLDKYLAWAQNQPHLEVSLINYDLVVDSNFESQVSYRPLSFNQLGRTLGTHILMKKKYFEATPLEKVVNARVTNYPNSETLNLELIGSQRFEKLEREFDKIRRQHAIQEQEVLRFEEDMLANFRKLHSLPPIEEHISTLNANANGGLSADDADLFKKELRERDEVIKTAQDSIDEWVKVETVLIVDKGYEMAKATLESLRGAIPKKDLEKLEQDLKAMTELRDRHSKVYPKIRKCGRSCKNHLFPRVFSKIE